MSSKADNLIKWKIHLKSSPSEVFNMISTDTGRNKFWATTESIVESDGTTKIKFTFPSGITWTGDVLEIHPNKLFKLHYFDNSICSFIIEDDGKGGCDLTLTDKLPSNEWWEVTYAGWGSVLMALKGAVDFNIDLRNHDPQRTWDQGYFDN